jgi:hypothetical protein
MCHHNGAGGHGTPHFCNEQCQPRFFRAVLQNGRVKVPPLDSGEVHA